jgi:hypothetical protein
MTKNLKYDLHFNQDSIVALSEAGAEFSDRVSANGQAAEEIYKQAIDDGLHCRFETADVRDSILKQ